MHKRWTAAVALGAMALILACDDKKFLTERPFDFIGPANFYNNAGDALAAINGVYADFINSTGDNYYGRNFVMIVEHTTEMWTSRLSATNERMQPDVYAIPVSHAYIQSIWASAYDAINRANSVLDHVPFISMDTALRSRIVAEAKFLRATHYFNLVRLWGGVPLKLHETQGLDSLAIPRNTRGRGVRADRAGPEGRDRGAAVGEDVHRRRHRSRLEGRGEDAAREDVPAARRHGRWHGGRLAERAHLRAPGAVATVTTRSSPTTSRCSTFIGGTVQRAEQRSDLRHRVHPRQRPWRTHLVAHGGERHGAVPRRGDERIVRGGEHLVPHLPRRRQAPRRHVPASRGTRTARP